MKAVVSILIIVLLRVCQHTEPFKEVPVAKQDPVAEIDPIAERMLLFQRNNGGWCQPGGDPIDYNKEVSAEQKAQLLKEKDKTDTTIDDGSTTREITYLLDAFDKTANPVYLNAAGKGVDFLLTAQYPSGGWSQFYPDSSSYRKHITFNDNAMVNVLWVLKNTADKKGAFGHLNSEKVAKARQAVEKGIECILKCQYVQKGELTVWCAQHDRNTFLPAKARAFELPSLSGSESVDIVLFLMARDQPEPEIIQSVKSAVAWFEKVAIKDKDTRLVYDDSGKTIDRIVYDAPGSTIWARFYDLETNKPFFTGRDSQPKDELKDIELERRIGYAYYGHFAEKLLNKEYPKWKQKWNI